MRAEGREVKLGGPPVIRRVLISERGWQEKQSQRCEDDAQEKKKLNICGHRLPPVNKYSSDCDG